MAWWLFVGLPCTTWLWCSRTDPPKVKLAFGLICRCHQCQAINALSMSSKTISLCRFSLFFRPPSSSPRIYVLRSKPNQMYNVPAFLSALITNSLPPLERRVKSILPIFFFSWLLFAAFSHEFPSSERKRYLRCLCTALMTLSENLNLDFFVRGGIRTAKTFQMKNERIKTVTVENRTEPRRRFKFYLGVARDSRRHK